MGASVQRACEGVNASGTSPLHSSSCRQLDAYPVGVWLPFKVSYKAQLTVRKHSSGEHSAMHFLKRLWQWYKDRRTEQSMLKGPCVYRTQTNQGHIPGRKMPTLPICTNS
jgi:hypothetical protein